MYYAMLNDNGRMQSYDSIKTDTHNIPFDNFSYLEAMMLCGYNFEDFVVASNKVILIPLEETVKRINAEEAIKQFIENGSAIQNEQDDVICELYENTIALSESNIELQARADETDDAICELYESILSMEEGGV